MRVWRFSLGVDPQDLTVGVRYGALAEGGWGISLHFLPGLSVSFASLPIAGELSRPVPLSLAPTPPTEPDAAAADREPSNVRRFRAASTAVPETHLPAPANDASRPRLRPAGWRGA